MNARLSFRKDAGLKGRYRLGILGMSIHFRTMAHGITAHGEFLPSLVAHSAELVTGG
jgi:hypothetical protein